MKHQTLTILLVLTIGARTRTDAAACYLSDTNACSAVAIGELQQFASNFIGWSNADRCSGSDDIPGLRRPEGPIGIPSPAHAEAQLADLAVPFIANEGQSDRRVAYYAQTLAGTVFVTRQGEIVHALPAARVTNHSRQAEGWTLTESFVGGRALPVAVLPSATKVSLFLGNDPARWQAHAATSEEVSLGEIYPGIAVQLKAHGKQVEKVFTVAPGAKVETIRVRVAGAHELAMASDGSLVVRTGLGDVSLTRPVAYQEISGRRHEITVNYAVVGDTYGFRVAAHEKLDERRPVIIDPLLQATYLDAYSSVLALALNGVTGEVYLAGSTYSSNFPGTGGGAQSTYAGGEYGGDAFVARLNPSLTMLDQATYLGGRGSNIGGYDYASALALNATTGEVYVAGTTSSDDFPGTGGGAQSAYGGGGIVHNLENGDAFVARLSADLTALDQATYLGGSQEDFGTALALNGATGEVYVAGSTHSSDFPGTSGGAQSGYAGTYDSFVMRLNPSLTALGQATYLGGSASDGARALALNAATGEVYVAGTTTSCDFPGTGGGAQSGPGALQLSDTFVARLNQSLTKLDQATYLGGSYSDEASALALNAGTGEVYVAGDTDSRDFPGTGGGAQSTYTGGDYGFDAFVARLNPSLTRLDQATYLGGRGSNIGGDDYARALALNATTGEVYVAGTTASLDFPGTTGGTQSAYNGYGNDAFVARLNPSLTTLGQATYLGGNGDDTVYALALNETTGEIYLAGTTSGNFPGISGGARSRYGDGGDSFVARLSADLASGTPTPTMCLIGDCDGSKTVDVTDIVTMVNVALGPAPMSTCGEGDGDGNEAIDVKEIAVAVKNALKGCSQ